MTLRRGWLLLVVIAGALTAADPVGVSFRRDLVPLLRERCVTCHGPQKAKGGYRLDTFERLLQPGRSGDLPVVRGDPVRSPFHRLLLARDPDDRMPKDADPLAPEQIALIGRWIKEGAPFDGPDPKASLESLPNPVSHPAAPARYPRPIAVAALAFGPGGTELAAGGYHEVLIFETATGSLRRRLAHLPERIAGLAWSPDGSTLAVAGGTPGRSGEVSLIDVNSGERRALLASAGDLYLAVVFSPDGRRLLAGGTDNAVSSFEVATGRREWFLAQHADWVTALAWSPDGTRFATASRDRTARVCEAVTGEAVASYTEHGAAVLSVAFTPDGKQVWSGGRDKRLRAWDAVNSETRQNLGEFDDDVSAVAVADGRLFAAGADGRVRHHLISDPGKVATYSEIGERITAMAVDAGSHQLAAASQEGRIRIWAFDRMEPLRSWLAAPGW